jgi:hypothetical protein
MADVAAHNSGISHTTLLLGSSSSAGDPRCHLAILFKLFRLTREIHNNTFIQLLLRPFFNQE